MEGSVVNSSTGAPLAGAAIRILGSGRVAGRIASALLDLGHTIHVRDPSLVARTAPSGAERLVGHLRRAPGRHARRATIDTGGLVALTVVCTGTCEPDRSLTDALARNGEPYIVLRTRPGTAVAGRVDRYACVEARRLILRSC